MKPLLLIFLSLLFSIGCSSEESVCADFESIHTFEDVSKNLSASVCIKRSSENPSYFNQMKIVGKDDVSTILYRIDNARLFTASNEEDARVNESRFIGYQVIMAKTDYMVLSCCGNNVADDITIEWNSISRSFEMLKTP